MWTRRGILDAESGLAAPAQLPKQGVSLAKARLLGHVDGATASERIALGKHGPARNFNGSILALSSSKGRSIPFLPLKHGQARVRSCLPSPPPRRRRTIGTQHSRS